MAPALPAAHLLATHDDGYSYVHDPVSGRSWEVGGGALEILQSLRAGWHPGQVVPRALHAQLAAEGLTESDLPRILADLAAQGILADGHDVERSCPAAGVHLFTVATPPVAWRRWILRAAICAPPVAALLVLLALAQAVGSGYRPDPTQARHLLEGIIVYVVAQAVLVVPHELGHAVVLAAATGRRVAVGLRWAGWPLFLHAFTNASLLYSVPARATRAAVLLAGTGAEVLVWSLLLACRSVLPAHWQPLAGTVVALGGGWAIVGNLLLPIRNDLYYLLCDWARIDDLEHQARLAARAAFFSSEPTPCAPWWLPWYGLASAALGPATVLAVALHLTTMGLPALALPLALAFAVGLFRRSLPAAT